ncbi:hypothetical protein DL96DRAFT_1600045 [Flagelloscypha sp. PMI_526]|nr:hypothetical protein DL96DRAFT_1600045 [Flagelloscypha sp. PMI_526]
MAQFDINQTYEDFLENEELSPPLAAILSLCELIKQSTAGTMFELVQAMHEGEESLKAERHNTISLTAGCKLFIAFVTSARYNTASFSDVKRKLVSQGERYAKEAITYRQKIAERAVEFIKDDSVILVHASSRVILQALIMAHRRKRISVYITEARPRSLGLKTAAALTEAGVPNTVILDSCVAYIMEKVDFVLVGSEAVLESGGLINAVGSSQIAIIAKAFGKPFYALAESYKFHRLFPLSQYDLPNQQPNILTAFAHSPLTPTQGRARSRSSVSITQRQKILTQEEILANNPDVDYTKPDLISLVISDVSVLTPEGVSQYLVGMFAE